ncbi:MAG: hypothetical protein ACRBBV_09680 [Paracoccaceae bacterium]
MTATKKELRQAFGNGMLPSGQDFSDLIDFMLPEATFDAHVQAFNTWKSRPEISFGTGAEAWVLKAHEDGNRLSLSPGNLPLPDGAGDLVLGAVVQIGARTGGALAAGAFAAGGAVTGMDPEAMQTLPADGKWHDVVLPPARAVAFEITAFTPAPPARPEGSLRRILRRVTGWQVQQDATLHATATATPDALDTSLSITQSPDPRSGWARLRRNLAWLAGGLLLGEAALRSPAGSHIRAAIGTIEGALVSMTGTAEGAVNSLLHDMFAAIGMTGWAITTDSDTLTCWLVVAGLVLWFARLLVMAWRGSATGLALQWRSHKSGGVTGRDSHALRISAAGNGSRSIAYAITRLWD